MILLSKLPAEYQEVEYIESTGTQYIDTGFKPNLDNGFKFDVKYGLTNDLSSRGCILSNYAATNHISFEITNGSYGVRGYFNNGVIDRSVADSNLTINTASFEISNNSYKITQNERTQTGTVTASGISNGYIYMFVDNQKRFNTFTKPLIIYRCKLYDGETLVRDFIPCYRKRDNTIGMYDLIQKKFYTNEGTGTFIKGSDSQLLEVKNITINNKQVKKIEDINGNVWWEKQEGGNIFDPTTATKINAYFENGTPNITSNAGNRVTYVACQPNTTYEIKKLLGKIFWVGCTVNEPAIGVATTSRQVGTTGTYDGTTTTSTTFTTDSTANYLVVRYTSIWTDGSANENSIFNSIEIYEQ